MTDADDSGAGPATRAAWRAAATETPPPALDAAILAQARDAMAPPARRRRAWPALIATAAVVVLGVQVLLRMPAERAVPAVPDDRHAAAADSTLNTTRPASTSGTAGRDTVETQSDRAWRAPQMPPAVPVERAAAGVSGTHERAKASAGAPAREAPATLAAPLPASAGPAPAAAAPPVPFDQRPASATLRVTPPGGEYDLRLDAIRAALDRDDEAGARTLLQDLRAAYPDRTVPDDIVRRLPVP